MNVVMDWGSLNINVPRDEMLLLQTVPVEVRQLDLTEFRYAMHDKQDDIAGMPFMHMHEHNPPVTVAGVALAQVVTIVNNYTVTFEDGLYNVNIVGGNSNVADNVVKNQVGVNTSNSAGLQDSASLQAASFQGHVTIDIYHGYEGTVFPTGTNRYPCKYLSDAKLIAEREGIDRLLFKSAYNLGINQLGDPDDVSGFYLEASTHAVGVLTIEPEALCFNTIFKGFQISGTLDGDSEIYECIVGDIDYFNGYIFGSALYGTITLNGNKDANFMNCKMLKIEETPVINAGGSGQNAIFNNWSGRLMIENITGDSKIGVGVDAGEIVVSDTCVAGSVSVHGNGTVIDNSPDTCYVVDKVTDGSELSNLRIVVEQLRPHHTGTGNIYYWNPYNGNDAYAGDHPDRAFKTFAHTHDTCENANHDTIIIVPGDPSGVTVITEAINVKKDYLFLRGPGRDVLVYHNANSGIQTSVTTNARGTEFSGFRIQNEVTNGYGLHSIGNFTLCNNLWFENCANGLLMEEHHPLVHSCKIHGATGFAIKMQGDISHGEIYDCTAGDAGDTTIQIDTTANTGGIKMRDTVIVGSAGYGVSLSATTRKFISESGNVIANNALGNFNDLGTGNILNVEGSPTSSEIADAVVHTNFSCP